MEVDFPVSDDDSIYHSDGDTTIERPPLEPDAIVLTGRDAEDLDKIMQAIEEEEMSSDEEDDESGSEASSEALTESIDPTSDDDMVDVSSKSPNGLVEELDDDENDVHDLARVENNVYDHRDNLVTMEKIPNPTNVAVLTSAIADDRIRPDGLKQNTNTSVLTEENNDSNKSPVEVEEVQMEEKSTKPPLSIPVNAPVMEPRNSSDDDDYMVSVPGQNRSLNHPDNAPVNPAAQLEKDQDDMTSIEKDSEETVQRAVSQESVERAVPIGIPMEDPTADTPHERLVSDIDPLAVNGGKPRTMEPVTPLSEEEGTHDVAVCPVKTNGTTPLPTAVEESDDDDFKDCADVDKAKTSTASKAVSPSKHKFVLDDVANGSLNAGESVDVTEMDKKTSLDVPDVEDIKHVNGNEVAAVPKQADLEGELEDTNLRSIGGKGNAPTKSVVPDFPVMDEIAITSPGVSAGDGNKSENGDIFGADRQVSEIPAAQRSDRPEDALEDFSSLTNKATLTEPLDRTKSARKSTGALFSLSSFYRAFKKPSTKSKEREVGAASSDGSKKSGEGSDLASDTNTPTTSVADRKGQSGSTLTIGGSKWRSRKSEIISREDVAAREKLFAARAKSDYTVASVSSSDQPGNDLEMRTEDEKKEEERHLRLEETLKSQIATLRSARSGFVDLALLTPMTEKTLAAVEVEAKRILQQMPEVQRRKEQLARQVEILEITTEAELSAKEKTLVAAKIKVAEAKCELDKLRHELFVLKRELNKAERVKSGDQLRMKNRRDKADKELRAATESKETMERNLEQRKAMLKNYKSEVSRLEKQVQDLEGDWE